MGEREDFLRELRALARERGALLVIDVKQGKGSHYWITVGNRKAPVPHKLKKQMRKIILKQLGLI